MNPTLTKKIVDELQRLSSRQQKQVLEYARALAGNGSSRGTGKALLTFAGCIPADDLHTMTQVIEETCERVDLNEW